MKCYLMLRNNKESGPFSLEEIRGIGLKPNDLIWVEGRSTVWCYPYELQELQAPGKIYIISQSPIQKKENKPQSNLIRSRGVYINIPEHFKRRESLPKSVVSFPKHINEEPEQERHYRQSSKKDDLQPIDPLTKPRSNTRFTRNELMKAYGIWILALLLLLGGTAWMLKFALELYRGQGIANNYIKPAAAPLKFLPEDAIPQTDEDASYQNALSREIVPVDTTQSSEKIKDNPKFGDLKKHLRIETNDYKIGVFGGISELALIVFNNSAYILDKVVIQVEYLKANGESIQKDKYTIFSLGPNSKKELEIPPTKRGVRVQYKITDAKAQSYKVTLIQA